MANFKHMHYVLVMHLSC